MKTEERISGKDVPVTNPFDLTACYANNFGFSSTDHDVTIHYTELVTMPGPDGPKPAHMLKALITVPIPIAQQLAHAIITHFAALHAIRIQQQGPVN